MFNPRVRLAPGLEAAPPPAGAPVRPNLRYVPGLGVPGLPTRDDLIRRDAAAVGRRRVLEAQLAAGLEVMFMPNDVVERIEFGAGYGGRRKSVLHLFGAACDGSKMHVIVENIPVFFEVLVPEGQDATKFLGGVRELVAPGGARGFEVRRGRPFDGYREGTAAFVRVSFDTTKDRTAALSEIRRYPHLRVYYNDTSAHYRKVAREARLTLTNWLRVSNYAPSRGGAHPDATPREGEASPLSRHLLRVPDVATIRSVVDPLASGTEKEAGGQIIRDDQFLAHDRTLVATWDLETISATGEVPRGWVAEDKLFMCCMTFHWQDDPAPLYSLCLCDIDLDPDPRWDTVVCGSEENLVRAVAVALRHFAPDFVVGFNDGDYDWRYILYTARATPGLLTYFVEQASALPMYRLTDQSVWQWNVRKGSRKLDDPARYTGVPIKINADSRAYSFYLDLPGMVAIDACISFRRLYSKAEIVRTTSLNFYLKLNRLPTKVDMTIHQMWAAYRGRDRRVMREVARYCVIDALSCQRLLAKRQVIRDRREVSALAYTSMADAIYTADGMKVRNMLLAYAERFGLRCRNAGCDETFAKADKYPGAWVFPPKKKGLNRARPLVALDFASLYPSLFMAYNFSPETLVRDAAVAAEMGARGVDLHHTRFEFPLGSAEQVEGWFVRHGGDESKIALFPHILIDLFGQRKALKKGMAPLQMQIEALDVRLAALGDGDGDGDGVGAPDAGGADGAPDAGGAEAIEAERAQLAYELSVIDVKQRALKVFMNTFYGESGNKLSSFFFVQIAGGITAAGRYNIQLAADIIRGRGWDVQYGDSVVGHTALVLRRGRGPPFVAAIGQLVAERDWGPHWGGKDAAETPGLAVWSDGGFTPVRRVIRHVRDGRPLWLVATADSYVVTTADHSLLTKEGARVRPGMVAPGTELLRSPLRDIAARFDAAAAAFAPTPAQLDEAYLLGGMYGTGVDEAGGRLLVDLALAPLIVRQFPRARVEVEEDAVAARYGRARRAVLVHTLAEYFVCQLRPDDDELRVPRPVMFAPLPLVVRFLRGVVALPPPAGDEGAGRRHRGLSGVEATELGILAARAGGGWAVSAGVDADGFPEFALLTPEDPRPPPSRAVRPVEAGTPLDITYDGGYVYDLETDSRRFHVGPGELVVHNTDSCYMTPPDGLFAGADAAFRGGEIDRREYWTRMVTTTMREIQGLRDVVNGRLAADNGGRFLRMDYEEVLFPWAILGKKKYFGVPHVGVPNFSPKALFVRGVDIVKLGQTELARSIGSRIMWAAVAVDEDRGMRAIVEDVIRDAVVRGGQWKFDDFVQSDAWKPDKQNVPVQTFVSRMRARLEGEQAENSARVGRGEAPLKLRYTLPAVGERFRYVIVAGGDTYNMKGHVTHPKKGDLMEYAHLAREDGTPIDVGFYFEHYVLGLCARFLGGDPEFAPPGGARAAMAYADIDEHCQKKAVAFLARFIRSVQNREPEHARKRGDAYRAAYTRARAEVVGALAPRVGWGVADLLEGGRLDHEALARATATKEFFDSAGGAAAELAPRDVAGCDAALREMGFTTDTGAIIKERTAALLGMARHLGASPPRRGNRLPDVLAQLDRDELALRARVGALVIRLRPALMTYRAFLSAAVGRWRTRQLAERGLCASAPEGAARAAPAGGAVAAPALALAGGDIAMLARLHGMWFTAVGIARARKHYVHLGLTLDRLRSQATGHLGAAPPPDWRARVAAAAHRLSLAER